MFFVITNLWRLLRYLIWLIRNLLLLQFMVLLAGMALFSVVAILATSEKAVETIDELFVLVDDGLKSIDHWARDKRGSSRTTSSGAAQAPTYIKRAFLWFISASMQLLVTVLALLRTIFTGATPFVEIVTGYSYNPSSEEKLESFMSTWRAALWPAAQFLLWAADALTWHPARVLRLMVTRVAKELAIEGISLHALTLVVSLTLMALIVRAVRTAPNPSSTPAPQRHYQVVARDDDESTVDDENDRPAPEEGSAGSSTLRRRRSIKIYMAQPTDGSK